MWVRISGLRLVQIKHTYFGSLKGVYFKATLHGTPFFEVSFSKQNPTPLLSNCFWHPQQVDTDHSSGPPDCNTRYPGKYSRPMYSIFVPDVHVCTV